MYLTRRIQVTPMVFRPILELQLIITVLKWVKWGLSRADPGFSVHDLESLCLDSYNLTLHVYNNFTPKSAERAIEFTEEVGSRHFIESSLHVANIVP